MRFPSLYLPPASPFPAYPDPATEMRRGARWKRRLPDGESDTMSQTALGRVIEPLLRRFVGVSMKSGLIHLHMELEALADRIDPHDWFLFAGFKPVPITVNGVLAFEVFLSERRVRVRKAYKTVP